MTDPVRNDASLARAADRLAALDAPEATRRMLERELERLHHLAPSSREADRIRNHFEWALELPWARPPRLATPDFDAVTRELADSHVGLPEVKQRVIEFLAVRNLGGGARGTVLCFAGPPGTGKSSMGRTVARALGRPVLTISVGAMMHERELIGVTHLRDGATPGTILAGIHRCGAPDPVILLDEIDKVSLGGEGTAAGAMLLLLDPEHNAEFFDEYLGVPFDLSRCLFLATANDTDDIPETLLDRMEVIEFEGYSESEKYEIARTHLLPRAREHAGLPAGKLKVTPAAMRSLIRNYTEEAGVRQLQRHLISLARKAAVGVVQRGEGLNVRVRDLFDHLGASTVDEELRLRRPLVGVATGLAWTSVGGALLPIEALMMAGSGRMILTGQIGDVMRESVQTALSYVRTSLTSFGLAPEMMDEIDMHLHFPSAATPKDGPSAGVAIVTALVSLLTRRPARHDVAMTGEMSLLGAVLPVGGIREKILAAIRGGVPRVVVPTRNAEDVRKLSKEIHDQVEVIQVEHVSEVLRLTLLTEPTRRASTTVQKAGLRRVARRAKERGHDG